MERRKFIRNMTLGSSILILPASLKASSMAHGSERRVKFGVISDVHNDVMHDGEYRLRTFLDDARKRELDFIIQLGDFCEPREENAVFMEIWDSYPGSKYHVLGNHDLDFGDGSTTRDVMKKFYKLENTYYSYDVSGFHFIVLDGNEKDPGNKSGYPRYIGEKQRKWLKEDLEKTELPVIVFSHQALGFLKESGITNDAEIRSIFEMENKRVGSKKVLSCINGHTHLDQNQEINGIQYIQINSASYMWLGGDFILEGRYSKSLDKHYPYIRYTAPYKDPVFAFIEINETDIIVEGRLSDFVGPHPSDMGYKVHDNPTPSITNKKISI
jgi:predicted phosphodiesterase